MSVKQHPYIPPLVDRRGQDRLTQLQIHTYADLFPENTFLTMQQMCGQTSPTAADMLLYYQIRSACRSKFPTFPNPPPTLAALENILVVEHGYKLITCIYNTTHLVTPEAKKRWEEDLGSTISEKQWQGICGQLKLLSSSYRLKRIHFKYIHRIYRTPVYLHRMGLRTDDRCWRCGDTQAGFLHVTWFCGPVAHFGGRSTTTRANHDRAHRANHTLSGAAG